MNGPNGEVRKGGTTQQAVQVMRIATGQEQERRQQPKTPQRKSKRSEARVGGAGGTRTLKAE